MKLAKQLLTIGMLLCSINTFARGGGGFGAGFGTGLAVGAIGTAAATRPYDRVEYVYPEYPEYVEDEVYYDRSDRVRDLEERTARLERENRRLRARQ